MMNNSQLCDGVRDVVCDLRPLGCLLVLIITVDKEGVTHISHTNHAQGNLTHAHIHALSLKTVQSAQNV